MSHRVSRTIQFSKNKQTNKNIEVPFILKLSEMGDTAVLQANSERMTFLASTEGWQWDLV